MRKGRALPLAVAVLLTSLATAGPATADANTDMRLGNFYARWCEYDAHLNVESREGEDWVFHGHIQIDRTGQVDELWIEQYDDNSLRIIRYLSGPETGQVQTIQTFPPEVKNIGGEQTANFKAKTAFGPGCEYTKYTELWL